MRAGTSHMRPDGDSRAAIDRISERVVEVPVRVERRADGHLRDRAQRFELKGRADGGLKSLDHQRGVAADQESAVAPRLQPFRTVRNRGVQAVADFSNRRRNLCRRWAAWRCADRRAAARQRRQRQREFRGGIQRAQRRCARKETPPGKRIRKVVHGDLQKSSRKHTGFTVAGQ